MESLAMGYYRFCIRVARLAYVNVLWVTFTLLGLGVFGVMPATIAMFAVTRKWVYGDAEVPIMKVFWGQYKSTFMQSNLLGGLLFLSGYLLIVEFRILQAQETIMYNVVSFGVLFILCMLAMILLYFFPVYVHFQLRFLDYLKWPFVIGMMHPILTLFLFGVFGFGGYMVYHTVPALFFFFGGSVSSYILMWGVSKTFVRYEAEEE